MCVCRCVCVVGMRYVFVIIGTTSLLITYSILAYCKGSKRSERGYACRTPSTIHVANKTRPATLNSVLFSAEMAHQSLYRAGVLCLPISA